jgi:hypothetical protein
MDLSESGVVRPQSGPFPKGASTFADPAESGLGGHHHVLREGTELPEGLKVIADGSDVSPLSHHPPTHHTIFNDVPMSEEEFRSRFLELGWEHAGNIKKK